MLCRAQLKGWDAGKTQVHHRAYHWHVPKRNRVWSVIINLDTKIKGRVIATRAITAIFRLNENCQMVEMLLAEMQTNYCPNIKEGVQYDQQSGPCSHVIEESLHIKGDIPRLYYP